MTPSEPAEPAGAAAPSAKVASAAPIASVASVASTTPPTASAATTAWATRRERGHHGLLRLMAWFAMAAGRPLARPVLHPIALYFLLASGPARRASRDFLTRATGRRAGWLDVYRHIHRFAATVLDRVYFLQGRFGAFEIESTGIELVRDPLLVGEGVLVAGAHFGSFEALRALGDEHAMPIAMLMYEENARLINATLDAIAPEARLRTIALGRPGAMLELRRWLDAGGLAGLLADRTLPGRSDRSRVWRLPFLGRPARFADGPFRLAALLKQRLCFMAGLYHGGRRYELRFVEIADFRPGADAGGLDLETRIRGALQRYVELLEALCRELPDNWFNFYDFWSDDADAEPAAPAEP